MVGMVITKAADDTTNAIQAHNRKKITEAYVPI